MKCYEAIKAIENYKAIKNTKAIEAKDCYISYRNESHEGYRN